MVYSSHKINITKKQRLWLSQQGDRKDLDVLVDKEGMFVLMYSPNGEIKIYLPKDEDLKIHIDNTNGAETVEIVEKPVEKKFKSKGKVRGP